MGQLECIVGPMYAGKSEELMRRLRRSQIAGKRVILFSPNIDTRNEDEVITHNGNKMPCFKAEYVQTVFHRSRYADVIGIDEVQFFKPTIVSTILNIVALDKTVIVSGLDTNYRFEPFTFMPELMAYAEKVDKLTAICNKCGSEATKTQRLIDGKPASLDGPEVLIGGLESYQARCRGCYEIG